MSIIHLKEKPRGAADGPTEANVARHVPDGPTLYVGRRDLNPPPFQADVVYSHLPASWWTLPLLTALRAEHPAARLVRVVADGAADDARLVALVDALFDGRIEPAQSAPHRATLSRAA